TSGKVAAILSSVGDILVVDIHPQLPTSLRSLAPDLHETESMTNRFPSLLRGERQFMPPVRVSHWTFDSDFHFNHHELPCISGDQTVQSGFQCIQSGPTEFAGLTFGKAYQVRVGHSQNTVHIAIV